MLTSEQCIVRYERGRAYPDRLTRGAHGHYVRYAKRMLAVYRTGVGSTRRELHRSVAGVLASEPDCPSKRIAAFCKLLDDASEFETDAGGKASALRLRVFEFAAGRHPLVRERDLLFEHTEAEVKDAIARELGLPWQEIASALYADVIDFQPLVTFRGYPDAEALLSRYNVAQLQAALYRAVSVTVTAEAVDGGGDFKTILRYAKLARLMHEIRRKRSGESAIDLAGPASVLRETRRYGVNLARFVPALIACSGWRMEARLVTPRGTKARLTLTSDDGLRSHLPPPEEFDSSVEEAFARRFGEAPRGGWSLLREAVILHRYQTTFVPDFLFHHEDGTEVLFEIVGFWTPEYLSRKRETLDKFRKHRILVAVPERSLAAPCGENARIAGNVVVYKNALTLAPVMLALEAFRPGAGTRRALSRPGNRRGPPRPPGRSARRTTHKPGPGPDADAV